MNNNFPVGALIFYDRNSKVGLGLIVKRVSSRLLVAPLMRNYIFSTNLSDILNIHYTFLTRLSPLQEKEILNNLKLLLVGRLQYQQPFFRDREASLTAWRRGYKEHRERQAQYDKYTY